MNYELTKSEKFLGDKPVQVYGVKCQNMENIAFEDISANFYLVKVLLEKLNSQNVSAQHFSDIVNDFVENDYKF
ncbi:MAG: DUF6514 family protein [Oscillospiraceae bacterium]